MGGTGVDGVTVRRGGRTVLRDVTLVADDGELLAVLGSSGSGKSTLLRTVAGLERPVAGRVLVRGRTVTTLPPGRRNLAMVFESGALMPFLDVARNLGWGLRARHVPEGEVRERVTGRARQLRLGGLLSRKPGALSHGERGLVGVGRALVARPDAFLLDEPLGHLDVAERLRVRRQIVGAVRSLGVTMLYVTHDQAEALAIADRVAVLHEGEVRQVAPPRELYERPADLVVAGSVGYPPIGLVSARLVSAGELAGFALGARTLPLWAPVPEPLRPYVDREVVLGLRAEHVDATGGAEPSAVTLDAIVTGVEFTGRQQVVTAAVGSPPVTAPGVDTVAGTSAGALLRSLSPPRSQVRRGDRLRLAVDATRAAVFDAASGRAIWHGG